MIYFLILFFIFSFRGFSLAPSSLKSFDYLNQILQEKEYDDIFDTLYSYVQRLKSSQGKILFRVQVQELLKELKELTHMTTLTELLRGLHLVSPFKTKRFIYNLLMTIAQKTIDSEVICTRHLSDYCASFYPYLNSALEQSESVVETGAGICLASVEILICYPQIKKIYCLSDMLSSQFSEILSMLFPELTVDGRSLSQVSLLEWYESIGETDIIIDHNGLFEYAPGDIGLLHFEVISYSKTQWFISPNCESTHISSYLPFANLWSDTLLEIYSYNFKSFFQKRKKYLTYSCLDPISHSNGLVVFFQFNETFMEGQLLRADAIYSRGIYMTYFLLQHSFDLDSRFSQLKRKILFEHQQFDEYIYLSLESSLIQARIYVPSLLSVYFPQIRKAWSQLFYEASRGFLSQSEYQLIEPVFSCSQVTPLIPRSCRSYFKNGLFTLQSS